jgi:hypothetical protein
VPDENGNSEDFLTGCSDDPKETDPRLERDAWVAVVSALQTLTDDDVRERVLSSAAAFFRITFASGGHLVPSSTLRSAPNHQQTVTAPFSEDRTITPKDFLVQKQPRTEVERVACLAYYLTHYMGVKYFKTIDISKLNTEAAQPKFVNASQAVENATKTHYLAAGAKGNKQISAGGELFVQALPDREAARTAMATMKPRRRRKSAQEEEEAELDGGDNQ